MRQTAWERFSEEEIFSWAELNQSFQNFRQALLHAVHEGQFGEQCIRERFAISGEHPQQFT